MLKHMPKSPGNLPIEKPGAAQKFKKQESGKLAIDESTIGKLFEMRSKATKDTPKFSIGRELFASLLKNQDAALATMTIDGELAGYIVATPIKESWAKDDLQEIKDVMKPSMDAALFGKISNAMDGGACYYLDDFVMAKRGDALLDMAKSFHAQLDDKSVKFVLVHGRLSEGRYKIYGSILKSGGFRKIHENEQPDWFGGENFMFMAFEKC